MDDTWIVVANRVTARILTHRRGEEPVETETLMCPEARQPGRAALTEAPGRSHDRMGPARHAMEPRTDVAEQLARRFAHRVAEFLDAGRKRNAFRQLVLVAEPDFLGLLHAALDPNCRDLVAGECRKDIVTRNPAEITAALPDTLRRQLHLKS